MELLGHASPIPGLGADFERCLAEAEQMTIRYDLATKTMHMDLYDLEHCMFDHEEYLGELFLHGMDETNPDLAWPDKLVVNFKQGACCNGKVEDISKEAEGQRKQE
ncbi:MAG TPA: hypothetical protein VN455_06590 [Methanotrichaceae archaeon]|nr:hypothetical protein [Methanotrichaceae archaeon]